jgi:hypothetical protein
MLAARQEAKPTHLLSSKRHFSYHQRAYAEMSENETPPDKSPFQGTACHMKQPSTIPNTPDMLHQRPIPIPHMKDAYT